MTCSNCGAAMRLHPAADYFACEYCGGRHFPEQGVDGVRVLEPAEGITCPVCAHPLAHAAIEGVRVLYCDRCRGLLIDTGAFVGVVDTLRQSRTAGSGRPHRFEPRELDRRIRCPRCRQPMYTHPYGGPGNIVIDNCPSCEVNWLDYSELRTISTA